MIPLICLDVDGTLVGRSGQVTDAVWAAAAAAVARGQRLALSTARGAFGSSWQMAGRLDGAGWHVFHAGAAVVHSGTGDIRSRSIENEIVDAAAELASDNDWLIEFYTATDYSVEDTSSLAIEHAGLLDVPFRARPRSALGTDPILRIQYVVLESHVPAVERALADLNLTVATATSPIMPGAAFVSATAAGIDKATGIETIASELGVAMTDVMMVGDGYNDLPAIRAVGHPVAMGNAVPEVKEYASYTVGDVADDGVVEALALSTEL